MLSSQNWFKKLYERRTNTPSQASENASERSTKFPFETYSIVVAHAPPPYVSYDHIMHLVFIYINLEDTNLMWNNNIQ
jgi:hypothetical protein